MRNSLRECNDDISEKGLGLIHSPLTPTLSPEAGEREKKLSLSGRAKKGAAVLNPVGAHCLPGF